MTGIFKDTDWLMLQKQKMELNKVIESKTIQLTEEERDSLTGILNWIDGVQDYLVDVERLPVEKIFGNYSRYE